MNDSPTSNPMDDPLIAYVHRVIGEAARDFGGVARISAGKLAVLVQMLADRTDEIERLRAENTRIKALIDLMGAYSAAAEGNV